MHSDGVWEIDLGLEKASLGRTEHHMANKQNQNNDREK
jgi:hypothetical protein